MKKNMASLEKERNFFKSENDRLKELPAVCSSRKRVQLEPIDLRTSRDTLLSLLPYLDQLKILHEAGVYSLTRSYLFQVYISILFLC